MDTIGYDWIRLDMIGYDLERLDTIQRALKGHHEFSNLPKVLLIKLSIPFQSTATMCLVGSKNQFCRAGF
jgi:hypothetical protein